MANYEIGGIPSIMYLHHGMARTRGGRLYCATAFWGGAQWVNYPWYSDNNGAVWNAMNPVSYLAGSSESRGQVVVDGGDNLYLIWLSNSAVSGDDLVYSMMVGACGKWSKPKWIYNSAGTILNVPAAAVGAYNNYVMVISTSATAASNNKVWYVISTDNGQSFLPGAGGYYNVSNDMGQGTYGLCSDLSGNFHCVHDYYDGARYQIVYNKYDSTAFTWGASTYLTSDISGNQLWPDIAADIYGHLHVTWVGAIAPGGFYSLRYKKSSDLGTNWAATQNLSNELVANALNASVTVADSSGTANEAAVNVMCRAWDAGAGAVGQYEIRGVLSNDGGSTWSPYATYSQNPPDQPKANTMGVYQIWPDQSRPETGYAFAYMVGSAVANYDTYYLTTATWNTWTPLRLFFAGPKV